MDTKHHTKLTAQERDNIAVLLASGRGIREISRKLERSPSTISEEVKRNRFKGKYYVAIHAQGKTERRRINARKRHPLKNPDVYKYVLGKLRKGWSPESIAGRLRKMCGKTIICHETIYSFIYSDHPEAKKLILRQYLPRGQKKRKKQRGRRTHKTHIPGRISIHNRPAQVDTRHEVGHWESDTMEGAAHKNGVYADQERLTRKIILSKINRISSDQVIIVQETLFTTLPDNLAKTVTYDNGKENTKHLVLRSLGIKTYFADPYSAWQKGSVENAIGIVRRYLPKGTDLTNISQKELTLIQEEINNRPRKVLNYNTPNEVFNSYLRCSDST